MIIVNKYSDITNILILQGMSRLLFPNQMKVDSSKKKPSADSPAAAAIIPVQPTSQPSPHPQSSAAEASANKPNIIPINSFSAVASNVNILDQIMNGMSQSQMSKKDWIVESKFIFGTS